MNKSGTKDRPIKSAAAANPTLFDRAALCAASGKGAHRMTLPRATLIGITALGVAAIGWADTAEFAPRIAYNGSPSLPIGLYRVAPIDSLRRSDLVVVPVPETYETLSLERRYVGPGAH